MKKGTDEFIMEFFNLEEKVGVLIHNLITIELWKEKMYPHLEKVLIWYFIFKLFYL